MKTFVVSDLHLGSRFTRAGLFLDFLSNLPRGAALVLNGDVVDRMCRVMPPEHARVLDRLAEESQRRTVIWIRGNHDEKHDPANKGRIEFRTSFSIDGVIHVEHGDDFTSESPIYQLFVRCFRAFHNMLIFFGAERVHVAFFAKNFPLLYEALRRHVRRGATEHARRNGFKAAACGHTHFAEETVLNGIRYFNTGSWTEEPVHYLEIDDDACRLMQYEKAKQQS